MSEAVRRLGVRIIDASSGAGALEPAFVERPLRQDLIEGIEEHTARADASETRRAYESDWGAFERWCEANGRNALPAHPETVAAYITDRGAVLVAGTGEYRYAPSTISRWTTSINVHHERAGLPVPGAFRVVKDTLAGIRRDHARPTRRMAPLLLADLRRALRGIDLQSYPDGIIGHRDAAILVLGMVGAFRRSELARTTVGDVLLHSEDGLHIRVPKSKTDQEGRGLTKALPFGTDPLTCPPCWFLRWFLVLDAHESGDRPRLMRVLRDAHLDSHICHGSPLLGGDGQSIYSRLDPKSALFRPVRRGGHIGSAAVSGAVVNSVVKRRLGAVGLDPNRFGAHSLRAGFVTQAFRSGAAPHHIMPQGGWTKESTVTIYRRENDPLQGNAVTQLDL